MLPESLLDRWAV
jgi:hypothetical protein